MSPRRGEASSYLVGWVSLRSRLRPASADAASGNAPRDASHAHDRLVCMWSRDADFTRQPRSSRGREPYGRRSSPHAGLVCTAPSRPRQEAERVERKSTRSPSVAHPPRAIAEESALSQSPRARDRGRRGRGSGWPQQPACGAFHTQCVCPLRVGQVLSDS